MRKFLKILVTTGILAILMFFVGPLPDTDMTVTFDAGNIGEDLDAYLANSEGKVSDIKAGAEKEIIWADPVSKQKTPYSLVYIHGFSASKEELRPVPDAIAAEIGANLFMTRLAGHGQNGEALAGAKVGDWANDFAEAIAIAEKLGEKVIVMGTSNGAALTTWGLSQLEFSRNIAGTVLVSPAYELQGIPTWVANMPWSETVLPILFGQERHWEPYNEHHGKWWTHRYPSRAIFNVTSLLDRLKEVDRAQLTVPALFIYSPNDTIVVTADIRKTISTWGGKTRMLEIENGGDPDNHVIAGDILSPGNSQLVIDAVVSWISDIGS